MSFLIRALKHLAIISFKKKQAAGNEEPCRREYYRGRIDGLQDAIKLLQIFDR